MHNWNKPKLWVPILLLLFSGTFSYAQQTTAPADTIPDTSISKEDSIYKLPYNPTTRPDFVQKDRLGDPFSNYMGQSPLLYGDPANMTMSFELDTGLNFSVTEKIGSIDYRPPTSITFEDYSNYQTQNLLKSYWQEKSVAVDGETAISGKRLIPKIYISPAFDRIFGGSYVEINPRGMVNLDFGGRFQRINNPSIPITQQRNGGFEFDQQISMNVVGKIGEKLRVTANFDNNNSFDFQNNLKVEFTGFEEDIIKKLEVGNVTMPVSNSLMTGAQNLFGIKSQLQFGKLFVTGIASTQRGKHDEVSIEGGGVQGREFEIKASDYDENRHFFLGHFFRNNYENWLQNIPQITSGIKVTRIEVYVINRNNDTKSQRNIVAFMDLAEGRVIYQDTDGEVMPGSGDVPNKNDANRLFSALQSITRDVDQIDGILEVAPYSMIKATHYDKINGARKLEDREYTFHEQLGYISLNRKLSSDEVLAVAYEYSYRGINYKVGELTEDYSNRPEDEVIIMKMLRPSKIAPRDQTNRRIPTWDLMMKNVYSLNASQVNSEGFQMRITYRDDRVGLDNPSINEGANTKDIPLIELLGLDKLNVNGDPPKDGNFDFVDNVTINTATGNIFFPVLEPFGDHLKSIFQPTEVELIQRYVYDTLYGTTKADAQLDVSKDKYFLSGSLKAGSSNEILLDGIKIAEGSVKVTAGGMVLIEGVDYTVDYNFGKVQILNESIINSGKSIKVTYEKADLFNFQSRTLLGANFEYRLNKDFTIGATVLHHFERPLYTRPSIGNEPPKNTKYGFDVNYRKESRFLTKLIDAIPLIQTKELSQVTFSGEFAQLMPGTSNLVNGEGTSYIDDFESTVTPFSLSNWLSWKVAATPTTSDNRFDLSGGVTDDLKFSYKRAKLSWYVIDNIFYRTGGAAKPPNINDVDLANHYIRPIEPQEIFTQKQLEVINTNYPIFDLAYFPTERGPYNYNPDLTTQGLLKDPQSNWGGVTTAIKSEVDFDKSNIEYIEFWLMDPFINSPNGVVLDGSANPQPNFTGGELIFNLGSVSEDVMRDRRMAFENGLPANGEITPENVTENNWGYVTNKQYINNAFNNEPGARTYQDIGLDGINDEDEQIKFSDFINSLPGNMVPAALDKIKSDPSADNFEYFLSETHDHNNTKILERYKSFNGLEENSPDLSNNVLPYTPSGSTLPDNEDLNVDNTLGDLEEYYEYRVDLKPGQLQVGEGFIRDKVTNIINGDEVSWYLFRIPVDQPADVIGNISGFKSIRYVRMYFTGWAQPVVLRTANLRLVGSQWRRYEGNLESKRFDEVPETQDSRLTISVVNIEENGQGGESGIPYVLPPGIIRDRDNTSVIERRLNEQSIQLCVDDLDDKNAHAAFKNVEMNLVNYGRVKMFLHAQSLDANDGDLRAFLRMGTGFDNYYEIEVPLNFTARGTTAANEIWPAENEIDVPFDELYKAKSLRNSTGMSIDLPFATTYKHYKITIVGNPKLSVVTNLMLGIRNPESADESSYDACIWANELRVTDFNRTAGWAGNASMNAQLADFANITASGRYTSFGFGNVQSKIGERTQETSYTYDISGSVNLDKFLPSKLGVKIPVFASYENRTVTPEYDPLDSDIPLESSLNAIASEKDRKEYKKAVIDLSEQKSLNLTNIRKDYTNPDKVKRFYNIENLSLSLAYSDKTRSNYNMASYQNLSYSGIVAYNFNPQDKPIEPFKNSDGFKSDWLKIIKEINFNPVLSNISIRGELRRNYIKTQYRNKDLSTIGVSPNFEKSFTFNRIYGVKWNITKAISLDYNARANALIDEPEGEITTESREVILENLKGFGRMKRFDQTFGANIRLPLDKLPITDWTNADFRYSVGYIWNSGALNQIDTLGNKIENKRTISATGKFDLVKLYNKVPYLKKINSPPRRRSNRRPSVSQDTTTVQKENKGLKTILRSLMMVRSVNITYGIKDGTALPGFRKSPFILGMDTTWSSPGVDFILGGQDPSIRHQAGQNGWLVDNPGLSTPFKQLQTIDLNIKSSIEPFNNFKIQVDLKKSKTSQYQEIYTTDTLGIYHSFNPTRTGGYNITFMSIKTAFVNDNREDVSPLFEEFINNRYIIEQRLLDQTGNIYGLNDQDILVPSFIAAYTGKSASEVKLSSFPAIPLPNWRLDFTGLGKLPSMRKQFSSFTISHAYSSTFSINNYTNSLLYTAPDELLLNNSIEDTGPASKVNDEGQFVPQFVMQQVIITERFAPLLKISMRTRSRLNASIEYKTERNLALSLSNTQVTELNSKDLVLSLGFTKSEIKLPFKIEGRTTTLENDLDFRMDLTIKDTKTIQRKFNETTTGEEASVNTITNGNVNIQVRPNIGYALNNRLTLQVYYERSINEPRITTSFRRTTSAFGVQVRFSLAQ
ncbi:MAG: cell surface protein SprA [Bacteroidota bacterium]